MLAVLACGGGDDAASPTPTNEPTPTRTPIDVPITNEITVFAASSLTEALTYMADDFEHLVPGVRVNVVFGGSQELRAQIEQGAEADVFISADRIQMDQVAQSGLVTGQRHIFALNRLAIIVPRANEADVLSAQDLAKPGLRLILGSQDSPIGNYTRLLLSAAAESGDFPAGYEEGVLANVVSEAKNVKEIVGAVRRGEADAGIVYATDITDEVAGDVQVIDIPDEVNPKVIYILAQTTSGVFTAYSAEFIDYLLDRDFGQPVLVSFGFESGL
jgi:molybdate transport system substrate-binding protein